jgi:rRNA pseudouridine-1189 N-methylase Emg1 (Nep1/Mra1 family)
MNQESRKKGPPQEFLDTGHFYEYGELILARKMKKNLIKLIDFLNPDQVFRFQQSGGLKKPFTIFNEISPYEHVICLVGGFQSGPFSETILNIPITDNISLFPVGLESWAVIQRIIVNYENQVIKYYERK